MADIRTSIVIEARAADAAKVLQELRKQFGQLGQSMKETGDRSTQSLAPISRSVDQVSASLRRMQSVLVGAFSVGAIIAAGRAVTQTAIQFEGLSNALKAVEGSIGTAQRDFAFVRSEAERLGLNLAGAARQFVGLAAAAQGTALAGQGVRDIFTAVNEAGVVLGLTSEQLEGALLAIQQIISKGTVSSEELRGQLGERLPGAFQVASRALGVTTEELGKLLEQGLVPAQKFLPLFARQLRQEFGAGVTDASKSARAEIERFRTAVTEMQLAFAQSGFLDALTTAFKSITESLADPAFKAGLRDLGAFIGDKIKFIVEHAKEIAIFGAALSGAGTGSRIGAIAGPKGAAIGGVVGAVAAGGGAAALLSGGSARAPNLSLEQRQALLERQIQSLEAAVGAASDRERPRIQSQLEAQRQRLADLKRPATASGDEAGANNGGQRDVLGLLGLLGGTKGGAARLPTLREEYNQQSALIKDALERESKLLTDQLADQLISIRDYFGQRDRISQAFFENESGRVQGEIDAQRRFIAQLQERQGKAGDRDKEAQIADQIAAAQQRIAKLDTELIVLGRQRATERAENARQEAAATKALAEALDDVRDRLADIAGGGGGDAVRQRLQRQFEPLLKQLRNQGDTAGVGDVNRLIDVEATRADLQKLENEFNSTLQRMRNTEQSINIQREAGLLSESAARQDILKLHRETADAVEGLIPRMERLAAAIPGEEKKNQVGAMKLEFERLKLVVDDVAIAVNSSVRDSFQGLFEDIARGSKSAKEIMLDFLRSIEQSITRIASQKLADQLFGGSGTGGAGGLVSRLLGFSAPGRGTNNASSASYQNSFDNPTTGGGGGPLGFLSSILPWIFHGGGIAGEGGGVRRAVPVMAFAGAPRLHTGGIPGLAPGEVPAVLEEGEEVLTRRDPRHRRNGGGMPQVIVNIQTQDVGSFMRSRGQVEAELASMVARGQRLR